MDWYVLCQISTKISIPFDSHKPDKLDSFVYLFHLNITQDEKKHFFLFHFLKVDKEKDLSWIGHKYLQSMPFFHLCQAHIDNHKLALYQIIGF